MHDYLKLTLLYSKVNTEIKINEMRFYCIHILFMFYAIIFATDTGHIVGEGNLHLSYHNKQLTCVVSHLIKPEYMSLFPCIKFLMKTKYTE